MPREIVRKPRLIYPQIATSLSIAQLSVLAELLFWRILPQADDQGRLTGEPRQLKAIACPMRDELTIEKLPELLAELEKSKLIIRYSNSSTECIQIAKWWDYQAGMRRIFPSQYPAPEGWQDRVKGVSDGQTPTDADKRRPKPEPEEEPEPESGTRITKPEPEEEGKPATTATETATESQLLRFLETLEGWRFGRAEDLIWLREFRQDWPDFNLSLAKACRDYYSGKPPPKNKGPWKNRFREWMVHERKFEKDRREKGENKGQRVKGARTAADFSSGKW